MKRALSGRAGRVFRGLAGSVGAVALLASMAATSAIADETGIVPFDGSTDEEHCIPLFPNNPLAKRDEVGQAWTDNNPNVYVGGDAELLNHEGEGLVIVEGDLNVDPPSDYEWSYIIGAGAGGGSGSWPSPGSLMLSVGGDLSVRAPGLAVGSWDHQGKWFVGGAVSGDVRWTDNRIYSIAKTPADGYRPELDAFDAELLGQPVNGVTSVLSSGTGLALEGDGTSLLQVFELGAGELATLNSEGTSRIEFTNIPENASMVLRAAGVTDVDLTGSLQFSLNGVEIASAEGDWNNWGSQDLTAWGNLTQRLLWHFPTQESINIGRADEYHHQFTGSIFASSLDADLYSEASTNGRVISFGHFTAGGGHGAERGRMEFHSFPFIYPGSLECSSNKVASFALSKSLVGTDGVAMGEADLQAFEDAGTRFVVLVTWMDESGATRLKEIELPANGSQVAGPQDIIVPEGGSVEVTFEELGVIDEPDGYEWVEGMFSVAGETGSPLTVEVFNGDVVPVSLTNVYSWEESQVEPGTFKVCKVVEGLPAEIAANTKFEIIASWLEGEESKEMSFMVAGNGECVDAGVELPADTKVSFTEGEAPKIEGFVWDGVTFSHEDITISSGQAVTVTATNTYSESANPGGFSGGFSLEKKLEGIDAKDLPADTVFKVKATWSIDGVSHSEVFELKADGKTVMGPQDLPIGTEVTFEEIDVPTIDGYKWKEAVFSDSKIEVEGTDTVTVTLVNKYTKDSKEPGDLATTGAVGVGVIALVGAGTLLAGVLLRKRRDI